jgi:sigma-B regulation protein RsbU (phosphoserine phosphatase)
MVYGVLDLETMELRYVSAGHPDVLYQPRDGDPRLITTADMAIGWMDDMEFEEHVLELSAGDRVYFYSDGIPEAMDHELSEFGDQRMIDVVSAAKPLPVDQAVASLLDAVEKWCVENGPKDDVSILAMQLAN